MAFFDYFRRSQKSASLAKDRLSIIVARERASTRGASDYLPQLQQELLAVIARYEKIDLSHVSVRLDSSGGCEVLELNIMMPEEVAAAKALSAGAAGGRRGPNVDGEGAGAAS
jgi:cell division topological specificity factor